MLFTESLLCGMKWCVSEYCCQWYQYTDRPLQQIPPPFFVCIHAVLKFLEVQSLFQFKRSLILIILIPSNT